MCFARIGGEYFKYDHGPVSVSEKAHIEPSAKIGKQCEGVSLCLRR